MTKINLEVSEALVASVWERSCYGKGFNSIHASSQILNSCLQLDKTKRD
jgi:hypothetical protein